MNANDNHIVRRSLGEKAADVLRDRIIYDELHFGERLVEQKLADELNISRICLRDGFSILEAEGLVIREKNHNTKVIDFTMQMAQDIYEMRIAIETMSLRLVFAKSEEKALLDLTSSMNDIAYAAASTDDIGKPGIFMGLDMRFHENIVVQGGNRYAINMWMILKSQLLAIYNRIMKKQYEAFRHQTYEEHDAICKKILNGEYDQAIELLAKHIRDNISYLNGINIK